MTNNTDLRIIIQDKGISAIHPIILKKVENNIILCSVANEKKKMNKKFNYTIIFSLEGFPFNGETPDILSYVIRKELQLESEKGHNLALKYGLEEEILNEVKEMAKKYI